MMQEDIYDSSFLVQLFDEMSQTYGLVNLFSSFGFSYRWRKQCVRSIKISQSSTVLDLMAGMGELYPDLLRFVGPDGRIKAVDLSPEMCARARKYVSVDHPSQYEVFQADALDCPIDNYSVDYVVSTFGLKTLKSEQIKRLAAEVFRVLRPGGQFAFLEISVPKLRLLKWPYLFYICHIIPLIGRLAMGNPENYRLLGIYTKAFQNCQAAATCFTEVNLEVQHHSYFYGCATGISGQKPKPETA